MLDRQLGGLFAGESIPILYVVFVFLECVGCHIFQREVFIYPVLLHVLLWTWILLLLAYISVEMTKYYLTKIPITSFKRLYFGVFFSLSVCVGLVFILEALLALAAAAALIINEIWYPTILWSREIWVVGCRDAGTWNSQQSQSHSNSLGVAISKVETYRHDIFQFPSDSGRHF